jgi:hypothetical protein
MNTTTVSGSSTRTGANGGGPAARIVNVIVSAWLIVSAFAWPHSMAQMTNTWIVGVIGVVVALAALFADARARYVNTVLAIWLFISAWALPGGRPGTIWNNVIVAIVMFLFSLQTSEHRPLRHA